MSYPEFPVMPDFPTTPKSKLSWTSWVAYLVGFAAGCWVSFSLYNQVDDRLYSIYEGANLGTGILIMQVITMAVVVWLLRIPVRRDEARLERENKANRERIIAEHRAAVSAWSDAQRDQVNEELSR